MTCEELIPGKRYRCEHGFEGEFWKLDNGEPVFLVGPRVSPVMLDYQISSCKDGWHESPNDRPR